MRTLAHDILFGVAVADALGVPVEFKSRNELKAKPLTDMIGYGTYNQAPGTWSDDTSMTLCLAECLLGEYNLAEFATSFVRWKYSAYWTPYNHLFDIGNTTSESISILRNILQKKEFLQLKNLGNTTDTHTNGNGSLMRILPLLLYIKGMDTNKQFQIIWENSALTHYHIRAALACLVYLKFAEYILCGQKKEEAYQKLRIEMEFFLKQKKEYKEEITHFQRIIKQDISKLSEDEISSTGYVIDSLEAAFWCVLRNENYKSTVLQAINLGHDTDTTAAIAGGIAGLIYGYSTIPEKWIWSLARSKDIGFLADKLNMKYCF